MHPQDPPQRQGGSLLYKHRVPNRAISTGLTGTVALPRQGSQRPQPRQRARRRPEGPARIDEQLHANRLRPQQRLSLW